MADVTETYSLNFETNAQKATGLVSELEKTLSEMGRSGDLATNGLNAASRGVLSIEKALGSSTLSVKKYSEGFSNLRKEVSEATKALQESAQAYVVGGGTNVVGRAASSMSEGEARKNLAVLAAENLTVAQASRERIRVAEQAAREEARQSEQARKNLQSLAQARNSLAAANQDARFSGMDKLSVATEKAARAQNNLAAAQKAYQNLSPDASTERQATVTNRLADTTRENTRAQEVLSRQTKELGNTASQASEGYVALRYALYDVGRTALSASAAITGTGVAALAAFGSQERAFTEVERIAEGSVDEVQHLRKELVDLSTEIPRSFQELSEIASLGGALGIDSTALDEFTSTVAKFVTLTGITEEAATTGFGRISQYLKVTEEDYDNLGSAILRAGNISVATEEQVLKFSSAIALPAARAGLLADEVVALGAATASFANINVEGAGSAFSRVFANIERAVSEGGESLDKFAGAAGYSSEQFRIAWGSDAGGTFNRIIQGLSQNVDGLVGNLDSLGIRNERDRRVVSALALNYQDYLRIVGETSNAWREGVYMSEAYGLVLDDLVSKWTIFTNALTNAAASVGASVAPAMKTLLEIATNTVVALSDFAQTPVGEAMVRIAATAGILAAAVTAVGGALAIAGASGLALRFALQQVAGSNLVASLSGMRGAILGVGTASNASAGAVLYLSKALKVLGRATIVGAALYAISELAFNTRESLIWLGEAFIWVANTAVEAFSTINPLLGAAVATGTHNLRSFGKSLQEWGKTFPDAAENIGSTKAPLTDFGKSLEDLEGTIPDLEGVGNGFDGIGKAAEEAAEKVYTLTDYARDLSSIWKRAFDIRFSSQSSADDIQDAFQKIRDAAEASAARVRDLKESITSLSADQGKLKSEIGTLEHFLKIARAYGDTKRASEIEAELAKKRADLSKKTNELTDKQKDLKKEQDSQNKSLKGNSQAARDNRQTITDLITKYQDHIAKLADSGLSQDDLKKKTKELRDEFLKEAEQLGFNQEELGKYAKAFDDVKVAVDKLPRKVTVNVDGLGPAERALKEFASNASKNLDKVKKASDAMNKSLKSTPQSLPGIDSSAAAKSYDLAGFRAEISALIKNLSWQLTQLKPWDRGEKYQTLVRRLQHARTQLHRGYQSGGYTGAGAANAPAGIVHRGEYVIPKNQVDQRTGMPYASALGQLMGGIQPTARPARGGSSGGGVGGPVDLSAHTIQQLARVIKTDLVIDGNIIGAVASNSYSANTRVGAA